MGYNEKFIFTYSALHVLTPDKQLAYSNLSEQYQPHTLLHLLHCFWKIFVESFWEEEVHHRGGDGETSHQDVRQNLIISACRLHRGTFRTTVE